MKKIILVDGNNLVFRSYFATAYSGRMMKNSKGFTTNAIYGFVTMINKIIKEEEPDYMAVAFDVGKTFRHEMYKEYKAGRAKTPQELHDQFPHCKEILTAMGIKYLECDNYEADDIIGTIVKITTDDPDYVSTIISSDRDLLQLINFETEVKLLKAGSFIRYDEKTFKDEYGIDPIKVIDLKAIAGDASDNIPGVKGLGDKTALKLLKEYGSLENIYENIDNIKGKMQEKLIKDKENAFFSKKLATIYQDVPLNIDLESIKVTEIDNEKLSSIYEELEFYSLMGSFKKKETPKKEFIEINNVDEINIKDDFAFYIEGNKTNYHQAEILGMGIADSNKTYYVKKELIKEVFTKFNTNKKYTFDLKKNIILLNKLDIKVNNVVFDMLISSYLLEYNLKDDLAYLMRNDNYECLLYSELLKTKFKEEKEIKNNCILKASYIYEYKDTHLEELEKENMSELFKQIEFPLIPILADMELSGVKVVKEVLKDQSDTIKAKLDIITKKIHKMAGVEFNISSPKQLSEVLFVKMEIPYIKKNPKKYSTAVKVLHKLIDVHPIIREILEYRNLSKIYSTYLEGLPNYINEDEKIHTIFKQTLTKTGRLSSVEPNLQNIPIKEELGRKIRKAFVPENDILFCADYSQIELRILAHISEDEKLIEAFVSGEDIHTKVAADIYDVEQLAVTPLMRNSAKAVIFGIVYGISSFGLGENLEINPSEASKFIAKYLELYPGVKNYMDSIVAEAKEEGSVRTLYNRKRTIDELKNPSFMIRNAGERIALNTPIQGTGADILKAAMIEIDKIFKEKNIKSKMILQVHDELIFDCLNSELKEIEEIVKNTMENIIKLSVPIKVEVKTGANWYKAT